MHPEDIARFVSKLTPRKLLNATKLVFSFYANRLFPSVSPWGLPMVLAIEPTTACNLRCPECPSGLRSFTRPTGRLSTDLFDNLLIQTHKDLLTLIFYFQGEPYIHPKFLDMVAKAHEKKIYTITSTNGHFLNDANAEATVKSGLDRLIISLDGTTQEVYQSYRKEGKLEHVLQGARNIVKWKKRLHSSTPHLIFQMLVVKPNEHQISDVHQLARDIGVDEVKLKSAQLYDYKNGHELMPSDPKYSRYTAQDDGTYKLKYKLHNSCWKLWHSSVVTWDGTVVPCCFDKDAKHPMGVVTDEPMSQIWKNQSYKEFRKSIRQGRDKIEICQNCSEGCSVWV